MRKRGFALALLLAAGAGIWPAAGQNNEQLGQRLFDVMSRNNPEVLPGRRVNHAKGEVFKGTFTASPGAAALSKAPHLQGGTVPMVIRFSDSGGTLTVPDRAEPVHGMAMTFLLPDGSSTDLMCLNMPVFVSATPEDFIAFNEALQASPPGSASPTAIQRHVAAHPETQRFLAMLKPMPESFGTASYFAIHAYRLTNAAGERHDVRWRIVPEAGELARKPEDAAASPPDALFEEMHGRLDRGPVAFRLQVQVAEPGDPTDNATIAWPESRRIVDLGQILVTAAVANPAEAEKPIGFLPGKELPGLEPGNDPFFAARAAVYAVAFRARNP
ncbi:catalase family peroxidase [Dankookia rubra]|nr:catalase family peroxidase [Dankookia rubra]